MNRTLKNFALAVAGVATAGSALVAVAGPASAVGARYNGTPVGTLDVRPASGTNQSAIDYTSSAPCPGGASFETRLFGAGMPDAGEIVTARTTANFSTTSPISSSFSNTPQFFADKNATTLSGSYDVVLRCTDRFGDASRGDFVRVITFSSPTAYTVQGASASPTPASPRPSATSTATMSPPPASECARPATVSLVQTTITATGKATVNVSASPGSTVRLFAYSQPSTTFRQVREQVLNSSGSTSFEITPPTNTKLYSQQVGCDPSASVVLNVRTQLSLNVVRNGVRNYTFSGSAIPARPNGLIVTLFRVTSDGRQIQTAQVRANANVGQPGYDSRRPAGSYSLTRQFTGDGRFGFVVRTGQDLQNAPGSSNVRSLLVF